MADIIWGNPGNPSNEVARILGVTRLRLGRALHRIKRWAGLGGRDRVTIWDDGSVSDEFGSVIGNTMARSTEAIPGTIAFATLRFLGDCLDPDRITAILGVQPTKAYQKGERYLAGPRAGHVTGRTGVWVFATDSVVNSAELDRHLELRADLIFREPAREERLQELHELMSRDGVKADVSCFWRGGPGTRPPLIPVNVISSFDELPAEIETDFEVDEV
jgi:Domain of unknown function (DUF4279)